MRAVLPSCTGFYLERDALERDPIGFVWRSAPAHHVALFVLFGLAFVLGWIALALVRITIDDAIAGKAFEFGPFAAFLRLQIDLPERLADAPVTLFPGIGLERAEFVLVTAASLVGLALAAALLALIMISLQGAVAARAAARMRRLVIDAVAGARPSAREEARQAIALSEEALASARGRLGAFVTTPVLAGGAIGLALLFALTIDWRLAAAAAASLTLFGLTWPRRFAIEAQTDKARREESGRARRALEDLLRRLPALHAHGTAAQERARLTAGLPARPGRSIRPRAGVVAMGAALAAALAPALLLAVGAWLGWRGETTAGEVVAAASATLLAALAIIALGRWNADIAATRPLLEEAARSFGALQARGRWEPTEALPGAGALAARRLAAYDPASGARIAGVELSLPMPSHVAIIGDVASGARVFAAVAAGQIDPTAGTMTFAGTDLSTVDPAERARRIAFAGGETILVDGTLRDNLLYGCQDPDAPDLDHRLVEATAAVGLDGLVHTRGLLGTVDPAREPKLAAAIVDARRAVRAALASEGLEALVEPFDPARYNRQATVGENILFGVPLGDTFREANLPSHPFVRAILEAEGLTKPLTAMGLSIAASMVEIFADVPEGHPLFDRFSFFAASERGYFEDLVERGGERRRGVESAKDRERLISLALRYSESRHRLGLLEPDLEARLVAARAAFADLLPTSLRPAIEFYHPDRLCAAASLQDNLLFGRVAQDRAGAETTVRRLVRRVLAERGLDPDVVRVGLDTRVDARASDFSPSELAAIDVSRCLMRRPDVLVIERALDGVPASAAEAMVARLRRALVGRGLLIVLPEFLGKMDSPPFDFVLRFNRGSAIVENRRAEAPALSRAEAAA